MGSILECLRKETIIQMVNQEVNYYCFNNPFFLDLLIKINVRKHPYFKREGSDIFTDKYITVT